MIRELVTKLNKIVVFRISEDMVIHVPVSEIPL